MITPEELRAIASWSRDLSEAEFEEARRGISFKSYGKGASICHVGDRLESWTGVADGLVKMATTSKTGKSATLAGMRSGAWFGEGTVIKAEPRRYELVALRETRLALMRRSTFLWLFEHSAAFNRFLVHQFNERLAQFISLAETERTLDSTGRLARNLAWQIERQGGVVQHAREFVDLACRESARPSETARVLGELLVTAEFFARNGRAFGQIAAQAGAPR